MVKPLLGNLGRTKAALATYCGGRSAAIDQPEDAKVDGPQSGLEAWLPRRVGGFRAPGLASTVAGNRTSGFRGAE